MRWLLVGVLLFATACASQIAETSSQRVFALQADYNALLAVAVAYESQPRCVQDAVQGCSDPDIVVQIRRIDDHAHTSLRAAQTTVRGAGDSNIDLALSAAREAVAALSEILTREGLL